MAVIGKIIGGCLGFHMLGPAGMLLGAFLGHGFDDEADRQIKKLKSPDASKSKAVPQGAEPVAQESVKFIQPLFSIIAKLCKVDGSVRPEEIQSVERFIQALGLDAVDRRYAISVFRDAKNSSKGFRDCAQHLAKQYQRAPQMLFSATEVLFQVAASDGAINVKEERYIDSIAEIFRLNIAEYHQMKSRYPALGSQFYDVLECSPDAPAEAIKRQYRKLVAKYHPDKLLSKNASPQAMKAANEKFRQVQEAYEEVRKERGL